MASGILGNVSRFLTKASLFVLVPVALISTCNGCHPSAVKAKVQSVAHIAPTPPPDPIITSRVLIDPDFSGPERELVLKGIRMWTDPLSDVLKVEISGDPNREAFEARIHQKMVLQQERAQSNIPEPEGEDEEDTWVDPHSKWDPFDPRAPFWDQAQGCDNHVMIFRHTSTDNIVKYIEHKIDPSGHGTLYGHTENSCHSKAIIIVADRLKTSEQFAEVLAHEFGHVLGLRHDFEANASIMHPDDKSTHCVTRRDADAFCARWNCPKSHVRMVQPKSCG